MKKKSSLLTVLILIFACTALGALEVPALKGYVNDYAGILSSSEEQQISQIFSAMEKTTSVQGSVLTIASLEGESIESFSLRTVEDWKLGQADRDNGLLIILAMEEKKIRIEVGYGLEGTMTDAKSGYIIREIVIPQFKKGNFANGLYQGASAVSGVITSTSDISEEELSSYRRKEKSSRPGIPFNFIIFIIIIILSSIGRMGRRRGGLFNALFLGSMLGSSSRRRGGFGGGSFGGGGFGGGFGGGGGGFGGGGASGGW